MNPTYDFTGQVALVTGASSGMGLATARAFAEAGAAVVLADINETTLSSAADDLTAVGHQVLGVRCDVSDEDSVAAMVTATVETFGRLDMAFNNAGIQVPPSDAADEPAEIFDRVNAVNLRGVWACMKHELAQMLTQGSGPIVNWSSLGGLVGLPGLAAYHASKHGVIGLTTSADLEYAPRRSRINAVCPGSIETPMVADMITKGELDRPNPPPRHRSPDSVRPKTSPHPCCGCAAPEPDTSSASPSPSTAATQHNDLQPNRQHLDPPSAKPLHCRRGSGSHNAALLARTDMSSVQWPFPPGISRARRRSRVSSRRVTPLPHQSTASRSERPASSVIASNARPACRSTSRTIASRSPSAVSTATARPSSRRSRSARSLRSAA
jgi:NAD(P)-dependent dehydrogenase (short-subunit alcohol dehydrogenase family)